MVGFDDWLLTPCGWFVLVCDGNFCCSLVWIFCDADRLLGIVLPASCGCQISSITNSYCALLALVHYSKDIVVEIVELDDGAQNVASVSSDYVFRRATVIIG